MSWGVIKLSDAVDVMHQGINTAADKVVYVESGVPIIQSKHLKNDELNFTGVKYLNKSDADKYSEKYIPKLGDILFANIGTIGKSVIVKKQYDFMFAWNVFVIRPKKQVVDVGFLKYYLDRLLSVNYYDKFLTGGTVKFINKKVMGGIEIPLPYPEDLEKSLKEQKRIAAILDKADGIRRKRKQAIQLADDFLRSVVLDMFGDPVTNPKGWEVCKFEDLIELVTYGLTVRPDYIEEGIPLISAKEIRTGVLAYESAPKISKIDFDKLSEKAKPKKNDILFSKTGSIGHCALVEADKLFAVTQNAARIVPDHEKVYSLFLLCFMKTKYFYDLANREAKGNAVKDLQLGTMKSFTVYCPPKAVQEKFISLYRKQIDVISYFDRFGDQELFSSLSQKAFEGEL